MQYIERDIEPTIEKHLSSREIIAIVGPRQCGKTTLIEHMLENLTHVNKISFEDIKVLRLFEEDIDSFIERYVKNYKYLFIDEVQYSKDSGKKLKFIYDTFHIKILISGSSAPELSIQSLKFLVGRIFIFQLYPFSFAEFLRAKNPQLFLIFQKGGYKNEIQMQLNKLLLEYILFGGYPRVVLAKTEEEKKLILENIYNIFLLKEIKEILELSENDKLIHLMKALSLQIGNMINYNELSILTGFQFHELKHYLKILEETYICNRISPYFTNKRTELVKIPKIYFFDLGFRNICIDNFNRERTDQGAMFENFIFSELIKKGKRIKFWRSKGGGEVDFILNDEIPVEIKTKTTQKTPKSLQSFIEKYQPKKGFVVSLNQTSRRKVGKILLTSFTQFIAQY